MNDTPNSKAAARTEDEATLISKDTSLGHTLPGRAIGEVVVGEEVMTARQVGRYQILEKLGEGAMASVYKAFDPSINRPLVIKFLHDNLCATAEYRQRFLREAKAAGMLSHPNIVTIFDVGEIENRPYIAMELLDGGPLNEMIPEGTELPLRDVVIFGIQIANALDYAHNRGIFHRDIKPANIIRLADGKTIKLVDFGIAYVAETGVSEHTRAGTVMGTPHYMSPEQATGGKTDARSDLWAVGVILYQLLTGQRPFNADNVATLLLRITQDTPKAVGALRQDVPPSLRRVVARCLNKPPDKRFQSGRELAEALTRVLQEIDPAQDRGKRRGMQLKVKLALTMAAVVAVTMALTSAFVTHRQYQAMLSQTVNEGSSLVKLIAVESAHSALSEDWVGIDVFVQEVARALDVRGLTIVDFKDVVRVSTNADSVGKPYQQIEGSPIPGRTASVSVVHSENQSGSAFAFVTPIKFQDKQIGKVLLVLSEDELAAVARESWWLMALLLVITAATVSLATYLLAERYSKPLKLLSESLNEIRQGHYDCRIDEKRNDEFGELYNNYNEMAASLEAHADGKSAVSATVDVPIS